MIDFSGFHENRLDQGSLFPFHSSWRVKTRRSVRLMVRPITTA